VQRAAAAIGPDRILGVILNRTDHSGMAQEYGYYYGYTDRAPRKAATGLRRFRLFSRRRASRRS